MKKVVIVDDSEVQLMLLELLLNQMGIEPVSFLDPLKALQYINNNQLDLLISDFNMPEMDGLELIHEVKKFHPSLSTAIVSALRDADGSLQKACEHSGVPLLQKPFDALALQAFVKSILKEDAKNVYCIRNKHSHCILRDKIAFKYCMNCCKDDMEDEKELIQTAVDAIEDFYPSELMLTHVSTKLSFVANTVQVGNNSDLKELFIIIKQLVVILHEYREAILNSNDIMRLVSSYLSVIGEWLENTFLSDTFSAQTNNYHDSIKADFQSIEMALGLGAICEEDYGDLDDLFF